MLTHQSSAAAKGKMLIGLPMLLACVTFFSGNSLAQNFERKGNTVTYKGNTFEYSGPGRSDTIMLMDPVTGTEVQKIVTMDPVPAKINGTKLYASKELNIPATADAENRQIEDYVLKNLSGELDKLSDDIYRMKLTNVVTDAKGKIVYYEYDGIAPLNANRKVPEQNAKDIARKIDQLLGKATRLKPSTVAGKPVPAITEISLYRYQVTVKNHRSSVSR